MNWKKALIYLLILVGSVPMDSADDSNKATQLIRVSQGLKENYFYLKTIGASVANYGDDTDEILYKRCLQHHIETEILHLQMDLGTAYEELRRTQELTIQLYYRILEANIKRAELDLILLTKRAHNNKKTNTHYYLNMGFREIAVAKKKLMTARNTHPLLFLMKLQDANYSLRSLKQSQKYILRLALLHEGAYESEEENISEFNAMKTEIIRVLPNSTEKYLRYHYDIHFKVYDKEDLFHKIWNNPNLHELANPLEGFESAYVRNPSLPFLPDSPIPQRNIGPENTQSEPSQE